MAWTKDTSAETARAYRESFTKDLAGLYTDRSEQRPVLEALSFDPQRLVLDAGCGTGRYLRALASQGARRFVGADISREMLRIAREDAGEGGFVTGLVQKLPFPDNTFDEIISVRVLQHIRTQQEAIDEMARVCRRGGSLTVLSLNSWTLHCAYKGLRQSKAGRIVDTPFKPFFKRRSPFRPWFHAYDNYCSLPELRRMFRKAGFRVVEQKGGTIGSPWMFNYLHVHKLLGPLERPVLLRYFRFCEAFENRVETWPVFRHLMDKIVVKGVKQ